PLPAVAVPGPVGFPVRCAVFQFLSPVVRPLPDAGSRPSKRTSVAGPVVPPLRAQFALLPSVPRAGSVPYRRPPDATVVGFVPFPAVAVLGPVGFPARCAASQFLSPAVRRLRDAGSRRSNPLSAA